MPPSEILRQADSCVKCGLCLPYCPTYRLSRDEAESPRGRISLIQGLLSGALEPDERSDFHLGRCLQCRACESFCPSQVPYGNIMDGVRAWQAQHRPSLRRFVHEKLLNRLSRPGRVAGVLSALANSDLPALARKLPAASVSAGARLLPDGLTTAPLPDFSAPSVPIAGHVALFTGCISRYLETPAHAAAIRVLSRFGYAVSVPNESQCCGAMHRHEGYPGTADRLRTASAELFDDARFDVVLGLASACTAELANASTLRGRVRDLTRFLANVTWPDDLEFEHSPLRVAVHTPCSQLNALKDGDAAFDLLSRLPGLVVTALPDNATCCGAAGAFVLRESTLANDLVKAKTAQLKPPLPQLLVTTNTGCALHLAARLREQGMAIPVCHPVQVLDRRMRETRP